MESHYRVEAARSERRRSDAHGVGVRRAIARSASGLLLSGLLVGCAASSPSQPEPLPQPIPPAPEPKPEPPKEDGKGWKSVTG